MQIKHAYKRPNDAESERQLVIAIYKLITLNVT
jgi:hypothetical protein